MKKLILISFVFFFIEAYGQNDIEPKKEAFDNVFKIEHAKDVKQTTVDGSGNFSLKVAAGTYYVYIKSSNRKGMSLTELDGKMYCKKVVIKENDEVNVSCNFDLY